MNTVVDAIFIGSIASTIAASCRCAQYETHSVPLGLLQRCEQVGHPYLHRVGTYLEFLGKPVHELRIIDVY